MGLTSYLSSIPFLSRYFGNQQPQGIVILGLHGGVGKTTVLYKLKDGSTVNCQHTVGFNLETVEINNTNYEIMDIGGGSGISRLWRHYLLNRKAVIFVIDSTDGRLDEAKLELQTLFTTEEIVNVPFLLLANKQDKEDAVSLDDMKKKLELEDWKHLRIHLQGIVATEGKGLPEAMEWLSRELANTGN